MSIKVFDRVKETSITSGSGTIVLAGASAGFQGFGSVLSSGDQTYYTLVNGNNWEVGLGTYLNGALARTAVLSSNNSNNLINLSGNTTAFIAYPAEASVYRNLSKQVVADTGGIIFSDGTILTSAGVSATGVLPTGGVDGQILAKVGSQNYSSEWIDNYAKEVVQYVKNSTGSILNKGQVVYINGADGTNPTVALAIASGENSSNKTLGFLKQNLNNGDFGYVVTEGFLDGLDTSGASTDGDPMWLSPSTSGSVVYGTGNKPYAPNHMVFVGYVIRKNVNNGRIYVKIQNGFELEELHNVVARNPNNNDILVYNSGSGLWSAQPNNSVSTTGSYVNPSWITNIAWAKVTGTPTTVSGYGIIDAATTGQLSNYYLNSNPSGYATVSQLSGYYPNNNPSGYATVSQLSSYYLNSNPSGYITASSLSPYYLASNPSGFITAATASGYYLNSNPSGYVNAAYVSGYQPLDADLTSLASTSGTGVYYRSASNTWSLVTFASPLNFTAGVLSASGLATSGDLNAYYPRTNPSGYAQTASLTGYYSATNPSGFITNSALSGYYPSNNPSGYATTASLTGYYSATNPSGFITNASLTGYYSVTNPSGYITSSSLAGYVPYVGATGNLNLGSNHLQAGSGIFSNSVRIGSYTLPTGDGLTGQVLTTNGVGVVTWTSVSGGSGGSGIASLNGLTNTAQVFSVSTTGVDFNINSAGSTHVFSIPDAGSGVRGVLNTGTQTITGDKSFDSSIYFTRPGSGITSVSHLRVEGAQSVALYRNGTQYFQVNNGYVAVGTNSAYGFQNNASYGGTIDTALYWEATDTIGLRDSTNPQTFRIYNTYTSTGNNEYGYLGWSTTTNTFTLGTTAGGTGVSTRNLEIRVGGYNFPIYTAYGQETTTLNRSWHFLRNVTIGAGGGTYSSMLVGNSSGQTASTNAALNGSALLGGLWIFGTYGGNYPAANNARHGTGAGVWCGYGSSPSDSGNGGNAGKFEVWLNYGGGSGVSGVKGQDGKFSIVNDAVNDTEVFAIDTDGHITITPNQILGGSGLASGENTDILFNLGRQVQFASGNIAQQRAIRIIPPTYSIVGTGVISSGATLSIAGPPIAGSGASVSGYALVVESGSVAIGTTVFATHSFDNQVTMYCGGGNYIFPSTQYGANNYAGSRGFGWTGTSTIQFGNRLSSSTWSNSQWQGGDLILSTPSGYMALQNAYIGLSNTMYFCWSSGDGRNGLSNGQAETRLGRVNRYSVGFHGDTSPISVLFANTYLGSGSYEAGIIDWQTTPNTLRIGTTQAGAGVARNLQLITSGTPRVTLLGNDGTVSFGDITTKPWLRLFPSGSDGYMELARPGVDNPGLFFQANNTTASIFFATSGAGLSFISGDGSVTLRTTSPVFGGSRNNSSVTPFIIRADVNNARDRDGSDLYIYGGEPLAGTSVNRSGGNVYVGGGRSTGSGLAGNIIIQKCLPGPTGTSFNTYSDAVVINSSGFVRIGGYTLPTGDGSLNQVLTTDGAGTVTWQTISSSGGGSGISSLNGLTNSVQTFSVSTTGVDFNINSSGSTHIFSIPDAGSGVRGVVSTGTQTIAGDKTFTGTLIGDANIFSNNTGGTATIGIRNGAGAGNRIQMTYGTGFQMASTYAVTWSPNSSNVNSPDVFLYRDAPGILANRNSTNAQMFRVANTFTSTGNFEAAVIDWQTTTNTLRIGTTQAGTGAARPLQLVTSGVARITVSSSGSVTIGGYTLPTGDGALNQVLTTDGAGTVTWQTVSGSGGSLTGSPSGIVYFNAGGNATSDANLMWNSGTANLNIIGTLTATSKSFLIPHPTSSGKMLQYACLEGPENGVYVRGTTSLDFIDLPDYWSELVNDNITVNLTPVGQFQPLYVINKSKSRIVVGGVAGMYDYVVYGERKDIKKLEVERWA